MLPGPKAADLAALHLLLTGQSAVDLPRLWFADRNGVDDFLGLCRFHVDEPRDVEQLRELHRDAVTYLREVHKYRLPSAITQPDHIQDVFLHASAGPRRLRRFACMVLKVMHIMHHVAGREAVFRAPISEAQLADRLNAQVFSVIDAMRAAGIGVYEFAVSQKSRASVVSKLLAKRDTLASQIFDKLRFRITVSSKGDLVMALIYLVRHLFPFNYVVPEQSRNNIITLDDIVRILDVAPELVHSYWAHHADERDAARADPVNEFSGSSYRTVNLVADIPLRIDDIDHVRKPAIAFALAEIQLVDVETELANNQGDSAHSKYKRRQLARVRRRLDGGLEKPGEEKD